MTFFKAVWSYPASDFKHGIREVDRMVNRLGEAGFNLILPVVKDEAGVFTFKTEKGKRYPMVDDWDPLKVLTEKAHDAGIKVHPWLCVFRDGEESVFLKENPSLTAMDRDGNPLLGGWVCPAHDRVQEYELSLYTEVMEKYDVDGVHLDYIRYANFNMCFCNRCVEAFRKTYDVDPRRLKSRDDAWNMWVEMRIKHIDMFVERVREEARSCGKEVSAAVFAEYPACVESVGQDWASWGLRGLVDYLFPMNYTQVVRLVRARSRIHASLISDSCLVAEGLAPWLPLTVSRLISEIEEALAAGVKGVVLYHYGALTDEMLATVRRLDAERRS